MKAYYIYPEDLRTSRDGLIWALLTEKLGYTEPPAAILIIPLETNQ